MRQHPEGCFKYSVARATTSRVEKQPDSRFNLPVSISYYSCNQLMRSFLVLILSTVVLATTYCTTVVRSYYYYSIIAHSSLSSPPPPQQRAAAYYPPISHLSPPTRKHSNNEGSCLRGCSQSARRAAPSPRRGPAAGGAGCLLLS